MRRILYKNKWYRLTTLIPGREYRLAIPEERAAVTVDRYELRRVVRAHYGLNRQRMA
ncbi:hypothetical protein KXR87_20230 [Yokenella regensburgei]|uniref:hypothetical protein n=1 Tax=Yokenella regensburgei TaxID=158877 RepID=UPI003F175D08